MSGFFKKLLLGLLACVGVAFFVAACGQQGVGQVQSLGKREAPRVKLTFFGNKADESNVHVIEKIMASYMQEHPDVVVTYESIKGRKYYEVLDKRMANSSGDDIFIIDHDTMLKLKGQGRLANLADLPTIENYRESTRMQFTDSDGVYWLPTTISAFGLYCNMDLLKEHGQSVPKNLKEFRQVCDYFVSKGITPIVANNDISLKTIMTGMSFYDTVQNGEGEKLIKSLNDGSLPLGTALEDGVKVVDTIISKKYVDREQTLKTMKTSDDLKIFAEGRHPFMLTGTWASRRLKTDFHAKFKYELHPLPLLENDSFLVTNPDVRLCVNAQSKHIKEAKDFVAYFTRPDNIHEFCDDQSSISPTNDKFISEVKELQPIIDCYDDGRFVRATSPKLLLPTWNMTRLAVVDLLQGKSVDYVINKLNNDSEKYLQSHKQG